MLHIYSYQSLDGLCSLVRRVARKDSDCVGDGDVGGNVDNNVSAEKRQNVLAVVDDLPRSILWHPTSSPQATTQQYTARIQHHSASPRALCFVEHGI